MNVASAMSFVWDTKPDFPSYIPFILYLIDIDLCLVHFCFSLSLLVSLLYVTQKEQVYSVPEPFLL